MSRRLIQRTQKELIKQLKEDPSGEKSTLLNASVTENVLPPMR
jgi:hypothetical protein